MSVICIKVVVKGKGRYKSAERSSVHDEEYRAENRAVGDTTRGSMKGGEVVITFNMEGAR